MKSGHCHHTPLDSPFFYLLPKRRFLTPWVWDLYGARLGRTVAIEDVIATNISRSAVLGLLRLFNAYNIGD
jgi:hypothetical protein